MRTQWEARQDPKDPNAWDVWCGETRVVKLPWQQKALAEQLAREHNVCLDFLRIGKAVIAEANEAVNPYSRLPRSLYEPLERAIAKAEAK